MSSPKATIRAAAVKKWAEEGSIEFDDESEVSEGEDGAYVQAWVFVDREEYESNQVG